MKVELVVNLDLSKRAKRIVAVALVPVVLVAGAAVAHANIAHVWKEGDTLKAADLNGNFADLDTRVTALETKPAAVTVTGWVTYSPTATPDGGSATPGPDPSPGAGTGLWRRVGDTMEVRIAMTIQNCQGGAIKWSIPIGYDVDLEKLPSGNAMVGMAQTWPIGSGVGSLANAQVLVQGAKPNVALQQGNSSVSCATLGNGDSVRMTFAVPIKGWSVNN